MARTWLILRGPSRAHAGKLASLSRVVDVAALDLPLALPVAADAPGPIHAAARAIGEAAGVVEEAELNSASAARLQAASIAVSQGSLVVDGTRVDKADVTAVHALASKGDPTLVLVRATGSLVVVTRARVDLSPMLPGVAKDEAFSRFAQGLPAFLGRPVDSTLLQPAASSVLALVSDPVDVLDLARLQKAPPQQEQKKAPAASSPSAAAAADEPITTRKCQSCSNVVTSQDGYTVFEQPMCASCANKYVDGHGQRAAILGGAFVVALALFVALTWNFDVIGRAIGALLVIFVFRMILSTGVQYDVDVDKGLGPARSKYRKSGFFKMWGDLDSKWWGKWLLHRGVFVVLGLVTWFTPIGAGHAAVFGDDDEKQRAEEEQQEAPAFKTITLRPLSGVAEHNGLKLELVEARSDGEVPVVVIDASKGGQTQKLTLRLDDAARRQTTLGVSWTILEVAVPPDPPSLLLTFDEVPSIWD